MVLIILLILISNTHESYAEEKLGAYERHLLEVYGWDDLTNYINYRVSKGDIRFLVQVGAYHNDTNFKGYTATPYTDSSNHSLYNFYMDKINEGFQLISEFHGAVVSPSTVSMTMISNSVGFNLEIASFIKSDEYQRLKQHVEIESKKMLEITTDQEKLIVMVMDHVYYNIVDQGHKINDNGMFDNEYIESKSKINLISSFFFHHLGIEHKIITGVPNYGGKEYWNLVNVDGVWSHCSSLSKYSFRSDSEMKQHYTWDYNLYPKADTKFIRGSGSIKPAKYSPIVELPPPAVTAQIIPLPSYRIPSDWAKDSVHTLHALEIMSGVGNNKISPKGNTTREQAIVLANRLFDHFNRYN
jgi:hypothetical protein